jgi:hypothetical protein
MGFISARMIMLCMNATTVSVSLTAHGGNRIFCK